jgi:hypothetical protein
MMRFLKLFWDLVFPTKAYKHYCAGYNYASRELLKGTEVKTLESFIENMIAFNDFTGFDRGVEAAIHDWKCLSNIKEQEASTLFAR